MQARLLLFHMLSLSHSSMTQTSGTSSFRAAARSCAPISPLPASTSLPTSSRRISRARLPACLTHLLKNIHGYRVPQFSEVYFLGTFAEMIKAWHVDIQLANAGAGADRRTCKVEPSSPSHPCTGTVPDRYRYYPTRTDTMSLLSLGRAGFHATMLPD